MTAVRQWRQYPLYSRSGCILFVVVSNICDVILPWINADVCEQLGWTADFSSKGGVKKKKGKKSIQEDGRLSVCSHTGSRCVYLGPQGG